MSQQPPSKFTDLRDSFAALREFLIVVAMLSILFAPGRVKSILADAGIRSLAGVEFDTKALAESESEVEQARSHIDRLKNQLAAAQQELEKATFASGKFYDPGLDTVSQILANAQRVTIETETNLNRSRAKTSDILQRHGHTHDATSAHRRFEQADGNSQAAIEPAAGDEALQR